MILKLLSSPSSPPENWSGEANIENWYITDIEKIVQDRPTGGQALTKAATSFVEGNVELMFVLQWKWGVFCQLRTSFFVLPWFLLHPRDVASWKAMPPCHVKRYHIMLLSATSAEGSVAIESSWSSYTRFTGWSLHLCGTESQGSCISWVVFNLVFSILPAFDRSNLYRFSIPAA